MVAFRLRRIVERKVDKTLGGLVELLECGHVRHLSKQQGRGLSPGKTFNWSRQCRQCASEEASAGPPIARVMKWYDEKGNVVEGLSTLRCTAEKPWDGKPREKTVILHVDAHEIDGKRRCPHCGWKQ